MEPKAEGHNPVIGVDPLHTVLIIFVPGHNVRRATHIWTILRSRHVVKHAFSPSFSPHGGPPNHGSLLSKGL